MLLALWRRPDRPLPPELSGRISRLLARPQGVRIGEATTWVVAWPPARLDRVEGRATACAVGHGLNGDLADRDWPLGHPRVRLEPDCLTIVAGPFPQYPLYYVRAEHDEYLVVCSRLEHLASLFPRASLERERIVSLIAGGVDFDAETTVYAGLRRIRPGETIVASANVVRVDRKFPRLGKTYRKGRPADLAAELRHTLDAAVGRAIGSSKRVAVFVSGGLDSSGILALAVARCRGVPGLELDAMSVGYAAPGDDRPYLAELTRSLGIVPRLMSAGGAGRWFRQSLCADGQPIVLASACLDFLLCSAAVERNSDVVLSGVSGDTVCGGTLPFAQLARRGHPVSALSGALRVRVPWTISRSRRVRQLLLSPLVPRALRRIRRRFARRPPWLTRRSWDIVMHCREAADESADDLPDTPDAWIRRLCTRDYLADGADLGGQVAAVTGCFPIDVFLDSDFVRFVLELDPVLLSHGHEFRGLYRLAMTGVLPERLRTRQDKAWFEPAIGAAAVAANALEMLRELSSLDALATCGLVDPVPFRSTVDMCLNALKRGERTDKDPADEQILRFWQLVSVEAFMREQGRDRDLT